MCWLRALRSENPQQYAENGVAVSIQAAKFLIDYASNLKAIGFDFISLASQQILIMASKLIK